MSQEELFWDETASTQPGNSYAAHDEARDAMTRDPRAYVKIGQGYKDRPADVLVCKCGADRFEVLVSDYWTGVRCRECKYQVCIHEG